MLCIRNRKTDKAHQKLELGNREMSQQLYRDVCYLTRHSFLGQDILHHSSSKSWRTKWVSTLFDRKIFRPTRISFLFYSLDNQSFKFSWIDISITWWTCCRMMKLLEDCFIRANRVGGRVPCIYPRIGGRFCGSCRQWGQLRPLMWGPLYRPIKGNCHFP